MSSDAMDAWRQLQPMARTFAAAIFVTSIGAHVFGVIPYAWLYFDPSVAIFKIPPQIWRFVSNFLLSGPQLSIVFDPYFVYQYLSQVEAGNPKFQRKEDVLWYLITVGGTILFLAHNVLGSASYCLPALILAICYTATQDQRGMKAGFFFFTVPAQLMPYCLLFMSLLMSPGLLPLQLCGLVAAHLHDFLYRLWPEFGGGRNWLETPAFVSRLITTPRLLQRDYGTGFRPQTQTSGSSTGASTGSGPLPDSWKTRGAGHRLG
ncbi:Der1-like family-domain-containing protein [Triangularia verruculosa]|uniref:Derlin n=1 Tax=Triangularia verruculosa TaxID=2587418 RepID=A0AAN6XT31_9PEZI|nr:Der1-like family-domain-containing protein [Triangularia verruculosa]